MRERGSTGSRTSSGGVGGLARRAFAALRARGHRPSDAPARRSTTVPGATSASPPSSAGTPIVVDYEPEVDGGADPGEVVWTWVPYEEDHSRGKDRPVLVVGRVGDRLCAVMLTSKPHPERTDQIEVGSGAWDAEGRTSYAKLDRLVAVRPDRIRREGAVLERSRFDRVVAELSDLPGWPRLPVDPI